MSAKLFVGNLSLDTTEHDLENLFSTVGPVQETLLMQDRMTMKSRGFGFVLMGETADGQKAIELLHGQPLDGRPLTVNEARPREERTGNDGTGGDSQRSYGYNGKSGSYGPR